MIGSWCDVEDNPNKLAHARQCEAAGHAVLHTAFVPLPTTVASYTLVSRPLPTRTQSPSIPPSVETTFAHVMETNGRTDCVIAGVRKGGRGQSGAARCELQEENSSVGGWDSGPISGDEVVS